MDVELSMTLIAKYIFRIKKIYGADLLSCGYNLKNVSSEFYSDTINITKDNDYLHYMMRYQMIIRSIYPTYNLSIPQISQYSYFSYENKNLLIKTKKTKIAICTKGSMYYRVLDKNYIKELISKINRKYNNVSFLFIGSDKEEADKIEQIKNEFSDMDIINLCAKTTLNELIYLTKNIHLLISVDTGVVHIAAANKTPSIVLYGSSAPEHSLGINHNLIAIYKKQNCSPCNKKQFVDKIKCKNPICLKSISIDEIFINIKKILN